MIKISNVLKKIIAINKVLKEVINESTVDKINFNGNPYKLTLDVTDAETKEGIRIKFTPMSSIVRASKADVTNMMKRKIDDKLKPMGISTSIDNDGLDKNTISLLLTVDQASTIIKSAFDETTNTKEEGNILFK